MRQVCARHPGQLLCIRLGSELLCVQCATDEVLRRKHARTLAKGQGE